MNKKGFTLIELLVVIGLIALLMIIFIPSLLSNSKNIKYKTYNSKIELIQTGAINFIENNTNAIKGNSGVCVNIDYLISKGYLVSDGKDDSYIINPVTNERLSGKVLLEYNIDANNNWVAKATYVDDATCSIVIQLPPDEYSSRYGVSNNEVPTGNSVVINDGASTTVSLDSKLTINNISGNAKEMCISNTPVCSDVLWVPYATTVAHWMLDSSNGVTTKTVYVKLRSASGLTSDSVTDTIEYVDPSPIITFTPNTDLSYKKSQSSVFKVDSYTNISTIRYGIVSTLSTNMSTSGSVLSFTPAKTIEKTISNSTYSGKYYFCIYAKNVSNYSVTKCSNVFYFDNTAPTISVDYSNTTAKSHTPIVTVTDNSSSIQTINYKWSSTMSSASSGGTSISSGATIPSYGKVDGTYYLCIYAVDIAGNVKNTYYSYVYDNTAPTISYFRINNGDPNTTSTTVNLNSSVSGASQMCFSNNYNSNACDGTWVSYNSSYGNWRLSGTAYATYKVYAWYKDSSGNMTSAVQDDINYIYAIIPSGSIEINNGAYSTTSTSVNIYIYAANAVKMCITTGSTCTPNIAINNPYSNTLSRTIAGYQNSSNSITVVLLSSTNHTYTMSDSIYYSVPVIERPTITATVDWDPSPYTGYLFAGTYVAVTCSSVSEISNFTAHDNSSQFYTHGDDFGRFTNYTPSSQTISIQMASASMYKCPLGYCTYIITASCSNISGGITDTSFTYYLETTGSY